MLGESVDDELENNIIDFLGRCQVRRFKLLCFVSNCGNSSDLLIQSSCFSPFLLLLPEIIHLVLSLLSYVAFQSSDGGYGGGPGQVIVCFLKMCGLLSFHENGNLKM